MDVEKVAGVHDVAAALVIASLVGTVLAVA
jgi:hypothetical protein